MADKAFIDSAVRVQILYERARKNGARFPVKVDAYPSVDYDEIKDGQIVFGKSAYCNKAEEIRAVERLHQIWDSALLRRLGPDKNVNGKRIIILNSHFDCVYPA